MISETASDLAYRGHNRQVVFVSDEDYFYYQENLKEWKENLGISRTRETKEGKKINLSPFVVVGEYDRAIFDYGKAVEINPGYALADYNRANAYYQKGDYDRAWEDVHKAQSLGYPVSPGFLKTLRETTGRER